MATSSLDDVIRQLRKGDDYNEVCSLLNRIAESSTFYPQLRYSDGDPEGIRLKRLETLGLIRWCNYPEEFYVICPLGKALVEVQAS